ncbi:hypothetical protein D3C86_460380 [compost metagenome]
MQRNIDQLPRLLLANQNAAAQDLMNGHPASRDINDLLAREMLAKDAGGGRSTSYSLPGSMS